MWITICIESRNISYNSESDLDMLFRDLKLYDTKINSIVFKRDDCFDFEIIGYNFRNNTCIEIISFLFFNKRETRNISRFFTSKNQEKICGEKLKQFCANESVA